MLRKVAHRFLELHDVCLPARADEAAYAEGFWLLPSRGKATLDGNILRYDESRATWEAEVWSFVCARMLERADFTTTPRMHTELTRCLGVHAERVASAR